MTTAQLTTFAIAMVAITNPIGNLAIFAGMTTDRSDAERRKSATTAAAAVLVVFLVMAWSGNLILKAFGVTIWAFEGAGGLIVLLLGLSMLHSKVSGMQHTKAEAEEAESKEAIGVVPLAIPIVAGPGAITTIIIHSSHYHSLTDRLETSLVGLGVSAIILVAFLGSGLISRLLGATGINVVTRIMGIILSAIGFGMIGAGVQGMLAGHG